MFKTFKEFLNERASVSKKAFIPKYGEPFEGGLYVGETETHYLIASEEQAEKTLPLEDAKDYCEKYSNHYSDWRLPMRQELKIATSHKEAKKIFNNTWIWCDNGVVGLRPTGVAYSPHSDGGNQYPIRTKLGARPFRVVEK